MKRKPKLPIIDATHCECIEGNKQWDDGFVYGVIAVRQACEHGKWHWQDYLKEGHCISDTVSPIPRRLFILSI